MLHPGEFLISVITGVGGFIASFQNLYTCKEAQQLPHHTNNFCITGLASESLDGSLFRSSTNYFATAALRILLLGVVCQDNKIR